MPQVFDSLFLSNTTRYSTVELMRVSRLAPLHSGSTWEWLYGVRFVNLSDFFGITGTGGHGSLLSFDLDAQAQNYLVGPQLGARWIQQQGRWQTGIEGRVAAAANFQNVRLKAGYINRETLRSEIFPNQSNTDSRSDTEFAPVGELRLDVAFQLSKAVYLKAGYTGTILGGITRASQRVDYTLPNIKVNENNKLEVFTANGFNFGIEINH